MIDIWIKDFNQNGNLVTTETLIQTIPAASEGDLKFVSATVKSEMGNAECLDFTIEGGTPFYDAFLQMKTYIRVTFDGDTIFYGRVLTIDNNSFRGTRKVRCEGPLSFLLDSQVEGIEESKRTDINIHDYLQQLLTNHNTQIENDLNKSFVLGEVPGNYSAGITNVQRIKNDLHAYGSDSWTDTKSAIEDLRSHYGGFLRARPIGRIGNGIALDWMNHYFNPNVISQTVEVGKNILDISDVTEIDNIFTVIIPIGKAAVKNEGSDGSTNKNLYIDGKILKVPDICNHFTREQLNEGYHHYEDYRDAIAKYGIIMKTVSFQDSTTKEALYNDACEWVRNNYQGEVTKFTIKAIDMRQIGNTTTKINIGDRVQIIYPVAKEDGSFEKRTTVQTCIAIQYDLYHPENNSYTFGIPANILTKTYGLKKQGNGVNSESSGMGGGGVGYPEDTEVDWLNCVRGWLMNHTFFYTGPKPFLPEYDEDTNENGRRDCEDEGWLSGPNLFVDNDYLVKVVGTDYSIPLRDTSVKTLTHEAIAKNNVVGYVYAHYGIDLYTYFNNVEPGIGDITPEYHSAILRGAEGGIGGLYKYFISSTPYGAVTPGLTGALRQTFSVINPLVSNQAIIKGYIDEDADYHIKMDDPDHPGQEIDKSLKNMAIEAINTEKKVGWVVRDKSGGGYEFTNPGEMTLSIENYEGGEIVVSRVAGQLTYLGNKSTQRLTAVSLNHMDSICGDFEYETNAQGISELKVKSGGGFRVEHYEKDENGNYKHDSQGRLITAEFGVFDDNTLTGGIVVDKINDNTTVTNILGTKVDIRATQMASIGIYTDDHYDAGFIVGRINAQDPASQTYVQIDGDFVHINASQVTVGSTSNVQAWMTTKGTELDTLEGLVADKITAYDAAIANLQADKIDANNINTKLGNVSQLVVNGLNVIGDCYVRNGGGSSQNVSAAIWDLDLTDNHDGTYTLKRKRISDGNWVEVGTFSRAGLVSGSWSGTTYTAVPSVSGASQVSTTISASVDSRTDKNVYFRVYYDSPISEHQLLAKTLELSEDTANQRVSLLEGIYERARISTSATYSSGQTAAGLTYNALSHTISRATSSENKVYTIGTTQGDWSSGSKTVHVNINNVVNDLVTAIVSIPTPAASDWSASYIGMQQDDPKMSVTVSVGGKALTGTVSASGAYSAGYNNGYPSGTVTIGTKVTGTTYNISISPTSGSAKAATKDFASIYADARAGYTLGTFTQATVNLEGGQDSVYVEVSSGGTNYYQAGTAITNLRNPGSGATYWDVGSNVTCYKGDGGSFTKQGNPAGTCYKVKSGGTKYYTRTGVSMDKRFSGQLFFNDMGVLKPLDSGFWYITNADRGATVYLSSDTYVELDPTSFAGYYAGTATGIDRGGTYTVTKRTPTLQGTAYGSITPVNGSTKKMLAATTRYKKGTTDTTHYWTKS